jgi:hypothetical protein
MANFPSSIKTFTNPAKTDIQTSPSHADQHGNANDEITAIETALGTGMSNVFAATAGTALTSVVSSQGTALTTLSSVVTSQGTSLVALTSVVSSQGTAISTLGSTKAPLASPTFTGTVTLPTTAGVVVSSSAGVVSVSYGTSGQLLTSNGTAVPTFQASASIPSSYLDTTTTLGTSDTKVPTQNAVKTYVDTEIGNIVGDKEFSVTGTLLTIHTNATSRGTQSASYVKLKETQISHGGIVEVTFSMSASNNTATAYARVYINGTAVGTEYSHPGEAVYVKTANFTVNADDLIQVYGKIVNTAYSCTVSNLIIKSSKVEVTTSIT